jgi:hypothetical protein
VHYYLICITQDFAAVSPCRISGRFLTLVYVRPWKVMCHFWATTTTVNEAPLDRSSSRFYFGNCWEYNDVGRQWRCTCCYDLITHRGGLAGGMEVHGVFPYISFGCNTDGSVRSQKMVNRIRCTPSICSRDCDIEIDPKLTSTTFDTVTVVLIR